MTKLVIGFFCNQAGNREYFEIENLIIKIQGKEIIIEDNEREDMNYRMQRVWRCMPHELKIRVRIEEREIIRETPWKHSKFIEMPVFFESDSRRTEEDFYIKDLG